MSSSKNDWLDDQQQCNLLNQKAWGHIPSLRSITHCVPMSTTPATDPERVWNILLIITATTQRNSLVALTSSYADQEDANPSRPCIVCATYKVTNRFPFLFDNVPMPHTIPGQISLPVDSVKIIVLSKTRWQVIKCFCVTRSTWNTTKTFAASIPDAFPFVTIKNE